MSYYIDPREDNCKILLRNIPQACEHLHKTLEEWYERKIKFEQPTIDYLDYLVSHAGFCAAPIQGGAEIYFEGEKYSDLMDEVLSEIAPFVEDGSYFELAGEDNAMWRWVLKNGRVYEIYPKIIWPDVV